MQTPYPKPMKQIFNVLIERDSDGWLVASVPSLEGCYTQAKTFDELNERVQEAIEVCLEDGSKPTEFVGMQQVAVEV